MKDPMNRENKPLPCPHGRQPRNGYDGWRSCPHCLGLNNIDWQAKDKELKKIHDLYKDK